MGGKQHGRMGRPRKGSTEDGFDRVKDYPKLAVAVRPLTRAKLNAAAAIEHRAAWIIVDDAINQYVDRMPAEDQKIVTAIAIRGQKDAS